MRGRRIWGAGGFVAVAVFFVSVSPAWAAVQFTVTPNFPATVGVGEDVAMSSLTITNTSTGKEANGTVRLDAIRLVPACGYTQGIPTTGDCGAIPADPGVFALSAQGGGGAGTNCADKTFTITTINSATGQVSFTSTTVPVTLQPPGTAFGGDTCTIYFSFKVLKKPTKNAGTAGLTSIQTAQLGFASGTNLSSGLSGHSLGSSLTTVSFQPADLQDLSVGAGSYPTGVVYKPQTNEIFVALGGLNKVVKVGSASTCGTATPASCSVSAVPGFGSKLSFPESLGLSAATVFAGNFHAPPSAAVVSESGGAFNVPGCVNPAGVAGTTVVSGGVARPSVWVTCPGSGKLGEFPARGGATVVGTLPGVGPEPSGVVADPISPGAVVVADARNNKLYIYTSPAAAPVSTVSLAPGCAPAYLATSAAVAPTNGTVVYVACPGTSDVESVPIGANGAFITGALRSFTATRVPVPSQDYGIAASGPTLVVTGSGSNDARIYDVRDLPAAVLGQVTLPANSAPDGVAIVGSEAFIADEGTGQISVIDPPAAPKLRKHHPASRRARARAAQAANASAAAVRRQLARGEPLIAPVIR